MMRASDLSSRIPFLRAIGDEEASALMNRAEVRRVARDEPIWLEGDPTKEFTFVVRGRAKVFHASNAGRESIIEIGQPGELLCAGAVCSASPYCCTAAALDEDAEVLAVPREDVMGLIAKSTAAARALIGEISCRTTNLCGRVEELSGGRVERRIAKLLLRLGDRLGTEEVDGIFVALPLGRQDLADMCATTIESASRVMARLRRERVVRTNRRGYVILNKPALEALLTEHAEPPAPRKRAQ